MTLRDSFAHYSGPLLNETVERATRYSRGKRPPDPFDSLAAVLRSATQMRRLVGDLEADQQFTLALFRRLPGIALRWDHAVRLASCTGIASPYQSLQILLRDGFLSLKPARGTDPLHRFAIADNSPVEALPLIFVSPIGLQAPEPPFPLEAVVPHATQAHWQTVDGWEFPIRLAVLWRMAWRDPFKQTQQRQVFKKDRERITNNPILASAMLGAATETVGIATLIYELALGLGWVDTDDDVHTSSRRLIDSWPDNLNDLLLQCARASLQLDGWNELGVKSPLNSFVQELPSARALVLLWLSTLDDDAGASLDELADRLCNVHPPWNLDGKIVGPLRSPDQRRQLARDWLHAFLLGPAFQLGITSVSVAASGPALVRLAPLGRRLLGLDAELPAQVEFAQSLLVQPNHEVIVYRQALSPKLLSRIVIFAEPKSSGAALMFEVNADSVYHALEAGLSAGEIIEFLEQHGGRKLPAGLAASIETWASKRGQITVYPSTDLFEFASPADMKDAVARGLTGEPINDRLLLVSDSEARLQNLRITASRDYRLPPQQCVEALADGITLKIDAAKSDLMLESELLRFADQVGEAEGPGLYRVSNHSLQRGFRHGLNIRRMEEWYRHRTGKGPPAAVFLLMRAVTDLALMAKELVVLFTDSSLVADGLLQHPATKDFFGPRLGPLALTVNADRLDDLKAALVELGIEFSLPRE